MANTLLYTWVGCTHSCSVTTMGMAMNVEYTGGSKMAVGRTQMELKSLVTPGNEYMTRGVDAMEIVPQHASSRNSTASLACQLVWAIRTPIAASAMATTSATYDRSIGGSCHHPQSLMTMPRLTRLVRDDACMIHRFVCAACYFAVVAADCK